MGNENKARLAHELLDEINARQDLTPEQTEVLRSFLPELPKQKTLEELRHAVHAAWSGTHGNKWLDDVDGELETWLSELHIQLKGLTPDKPAPKLPEGMRMATHPEYGLCVVSPITDEDGERRIFYLSDSTEAGADCRWVPVVHLEFVDAEPAKPAHPEFLETEADYENAPNGTIVAAGAKMPYIKGAGLGAEHLWRSAMDGTSTSFDMSIFPMSLEKKRVLRWGWGK